MHKETKMRIILNQKRGGKCDGKGGKNTTWNKFHARKEIKVLQNSEKIILIYYGYKRKERGPDVDGDGWRINGDGKHFEIFLVNVSI